MVDFAGNKTFVAAGAVAAYASILRVMKLTIVLLVAGLVQASAYTGHSQQLTMDVRDESLIRVFAIIKKQTGYVYFGATEILARAKPVTIRVRNESLLRVLDLCFKDQPLEYTINGKTIAVSEKKSTISGGANGNGDMSTSALIDVRGRVTNEQNDPVAGVSVQVKGTKMGTSTNGDGEFSLSKVPHDAVLVLTAVNIQSIEALVDGRRNLDLKVKGKTGKLDEVQVIAYGKTSQRFNVGNVTTVKAEDIEKQPVNNPLLALQGRVPGLEVTQATGMNGGKVTVRIQGINSLRSGREPLVVIDGVPYPTQLNSTYLLDNITQGGSPLNYINPSDIESMDVLKDADATAIYGSRAANGAILITTKKGKIGKTKLSINLQQGWGKVTRKVDMMNTRQYLDMRYEAYKNDGINISTLTPRSSNYDLTLWDTTRYTDWQKTLIGSTAQYTNINASISGGTAAMQYLIGATLNRQTTVFPGSSDDKKGGLHFNINGISPNQKFRIQLNGNYMYDDNRLPVGDLTAQSIILAPNAPSLYNVDGTLNWAPNTAGTSTWANPLAATNLSGLTNTTHNLVSNMNLGYRILPGLEISSNIGFSRLQSDIFQAIRLEFYQPETRPFSQRVAEFQNRSMTSWIIEPLLQYTGRIGRGKIEGLLGSTFQHNSNQASYLIGRGYNSDAVMKNLKFATTIEVPQSLPNTLYKYTALFGRLNYNWDEKYIFSFTARRDGSSRFGDKNKFHNFGSAGIGWIFSQEKWIQNILPFLSFGKLRSSYGTTGNDQIRDNSYLSLYVVAGSGIPYQNSIGTNVINLPNPHLQWEETRKWQVGMDLGFWSDRIILNATLVCNRSSNQLIQYSLSNITGFNNIIQNLSATIQNTSWEFMLNTTNIKVKDFSWNSSINLTIPRNKLVSFPNIEKTPYGSPFTNVFVGQPLDLVPAFRYAGLDPANGEYMIFDHDGTPTSNPTNPKQSQFISLLPRLYGGLQNNFSYKGFQLDFLFQFVRQKGFKQLYYNSINNPGTFSRFTGGNQPVTVLNRWQKPGDQTTFARYTSNNNNIVIWPEYSDAGYDYAASYIRLKNLSFSWQLPATWLQKASMQNGRLYIRGQNLATITNYSGLDPETQSFHTLPPLQMWTVGIQVEL